MVRSDGSRATAPRGGVLHPAADLALPRPLEPPPPWSVATASPPCPRGEPLVPGQKRALPRWDSYCCQFFSMMVSS